MLFTDGWLICEWIYQYSTEGQTNYSCWTGFCRKKEKIEGGGTMTQLIHLCAEYNVPDSESCRQTIQNEIGKGDQRKRHKIIQRDKRSGHVRRDSLQALRRTKNPRKVEKSNMMANLAPKLRSGKTAKRAY